MSEFEEHKEIIRYFRERWPEHASAIRVSANGIHRGKGHAAMRRIAKEKALGFVTGEADIVFLIPRGSLDRSLLSIKRTKQHAGQPKSSLSISAITTASVTALV